MNISKVIVLFKRLTIWLTEGVVLSLLGILIAEMLIFIIAPLEGITDILCALGAAVGNAIAFARVFRSKQRYVSLVFFIASMYFLGWYCYEYGIVLGTDKDTMIMRFVYACLAAGVISVGYEFVARYSRNHQNK